MRFLQLAKPLYSFCLTTFSILAAGEVTLAQATGNPTNPNRPVTILGQIRETPYVVVIPTENRQVFTLVQRYIPTAFLTNSRLGPYIQAGAYADRGSAEFLSEQLRQRGLDARVVFLPL